MKVLVVGGGGREHAIAWKISKSPVVNKVYCAPGNPGTMEFAENIELKIEDIKGLADFAEKNHINLTVVGPELPLTLGISEEFERRGLFLFGPDSRAAELEGSKVFSKNFMRKYSIPTAQYETFDSVDAAKEYIKAINGPVVVKADGLAAGKGVLICKEMDDAFKAVETILVENKFGAAGNRIIVEKFLEGEEVSFMAVTDGINCLPLMSSRDHKQVFDGNKGPNTGGMGAYAPAPIVSNEMTQKIMQKIILPTLKGMALEGRTYKGILYAGLMINEGEPLTLEFNCRFGDPETQPIMMMMKSDIFPLFQRVASGNLEGMDIEWHNGSSVCVVLASGGYPSDYKKGIPIKGLKNLHENANTIVFHAGTAIKENRLVTHGGRVLGVTAIGENLETAIQSVYKGVEGISWEGMHYRKDIAIRN